MKMLKDLKIKKCVNGFDQKDCLKQTNIYMKVKTASI